MPRIKVFFSDGTTQIFHEEQAFQTIKTFKSKENPDKNDVSLSEIFTLWSHVHDGLVPSFLEILSNCMYFFDIENPGTYYSSSQVVKIETI